MTALGISLWWWVALAVLMFWVVGAHNRLVRLRGAVTRNFTTFAAQIDRNLELLQRCVSTLTDETPRDDRKDGQAAWDGLKGSLHQMVSSLAAARSKPFDDDAMHAYGSADGVLRNAWDRVRQLPDDLAGPAVPDGVLAEWATLTAQTAMLHGALDESVKAYNRAIRQFPAVLLAGFMGYRRAQEVPAP